MTSMNRGIIYLLTGPAHAARAVVSLWSLRRHYDGPITLYTTHSESHEVGRRCAADGRLGIEHRATEQVAARKNSSFLTKVRLVTEAPYDVTAYLDADTVVAGGIAELLDVSEADQCHVTQFSDWQTCGRTLRKRINAWRGLRQDRYDPAWLEGLVDEALRPAPAINSGVVAFRRDAAILGPWRELTEVGRSMFICDEIALQLVLPRFPHKVLDCRWNCSPLYGVNRSAARIWHLHGEKHVSRPACRAIWLPLYQQCLQANVAGLAEWAPGADKRLRRYLEAAKEVVR